MSVCAAPTCSHQIFDGSSYYVDVDVKSRRKIEAGQRDFLKYKLSLLIYEYGVINCKQCFIVFCIEFCFNS